MSNDDLEACAGIVQRGDPDRFVAVMAAPALTRDVLFPIYAFNVEVSRAPWVTQEPMIAEMRLQWWRDALDEIRAKTEFRRHEVMSPLVGILDDESVDVLESLIEARRWDIYKDPFEDGAHQTRYLEQTAGGLMWVAARSLGACDKQVALDAGYALGVANWLRAIPALEDAQRVPLVDGRSEAVCALAQDGLARLDRARKARKHVSRAAAPAFLAAWEAGAILKQASQEPGRVAGGALGQSEFARKASLMMRAISGRW